MVSVSPRLIDDLEFDEDLDITSTDPRFAWGFGSLTLETRGHSDTEYHDDERAFASTPEPSAGRKKKRQRQSDVAVNAVPVFTYSTVADGDAFRLAVLRPGTGSAVVECDLVWESSRHPRSSYCCLSYCWETVEREANIKVDGYRFPVTKNLLGAMHSLRNQRSPLLIWIDQICINQNDDRERGHQVSIMKHIFNQAREVFIWLGQEDDRSDKLCEYAKRIRRGDDNRKGTLKRLMNQRELKHSIQKLLERPWFERVWVIPEVVLASHTTVVCGNSHMSWDNLVRLIRDVDFPVSGFDKQFNLLGNPRQRIAIITQMIASQREALAHTDITQLLILGKGSKATDVRDMVYAFYALTHVTTFPDYSRQPEWLFTEIIHMYLNSLMWEASYSSWHELAEQQKVFQLMSILYSAGTLHQYKHWNLPSWVPDWTYSWHLAPVWTKTDPNFITGRGKDEWTLGIRSDFRAGGERLETFEILEGSRGQLRISALILDTVRIVNETTPAPTPDASQELVPEHGDDWHTVDPSVLRYGRCFFTTDQGIVGLATPGIEPDDQIAVFPGGDVPVVLRPSPEPQRRHKLYKIVCECYVQACAVMSGEALKSNWSLVEDIILI